MSSVTHIHTHTHTLSLSEITALVTLSGAFSVPFTPRFLPTSDIFPCLALADYTAVILFSTDVWNY